MSLVKVVLERDSINRGLEGVPPVDSSSRIYFQRSVYILNPRTRLYTEVSLTYTRPSVSTTEVGFGSATVQRSGDEGSRPTLVSVPTTLVKTLLRL